MADLLIVLSLGSHGDKEALQKYIDGLKIDTLVPADDHSSEDKAKYDRMELMKDFGSGWKRVGEEDRWDREIREMSRARR